MENNKIKCIDGSEPHESFNGWENFLKICDLLEEFNGIKHYCYANAHYIVLSNGILIKVFGGESKILIAKIKELGEKRYIQEYEEHTTATAKDELFRAIDKLTETLADIRKAVSKL